MLKNSQKGVLGADQIKKRALGTRLVWTPDDPIWGNSGVVNSFALCFFTGIKSTQCNKSCASCRESFAHCNKTTGVCKSNCRRTKLCTRNNDLCLATWRWKNDRVVMFTSCFRLPPFSNSSQYSKKCNASILNGTRTCLCQGSNCNKNPIELVTKKWKRTLSSENPKQLRQKREYSKFLCGFQ